MNQNLSKSLGQLVVSLIITLLISLYYRHRTVPSTLRYSTFGPRFWTGSVDACVLWPVTFITWNLLSLDIPRVVIAILLVVRSLTWLVYTVVMHARYGQTVGKMVTKVRVVDFQTEGKISWRQAWLREGIPMVLNLGFLAYNIIEIMNGSLLPGDGVNHRQPLTASYWAITTLPLLWFVAEVLTMLTNKKRRALHDFIAGTVVIRTNTPEQIVPINPPLIRYGNIQI